MGRERQARADEWRALDDLVEQVTDKTAGAKDPGLPYVGLEQIAPDGPHLLGTLGSESSVSVNNLFQREDILFGKLRPNLHKSVAALFAGYCSTDILVLRPRAGFDPAFVARVFQTEAVFAEAVRTAEGTKMPRTSWEKLKDFRVFVPRDGREQRAIAGTLDAADALLDRTADVLAKLGHLKAGLAQDLLRPSLREALPSAWASTPLGDLLRRVEYGISVPLAEAGAIPVLRMMNLQNGALDLADLRYSDGAEARGCLLRRGDVLFNRTNSREHVGRTALWRGELGRASFASYLVRFRTNPDRLDPEYLTAFMNLPQVQARIKLLATPAVQQVNVNPTRLRRELLVPHPVAVEEQREVVARLRSLDKRIAAEERALAKLRLQKRGLMNDLLGGRVRA